MPEKLHDVLPGGKIIMDENGKVKSAVTYKMIAEALFENYESIYDINLETNEYKTYFQSDNYRELKLAKEGNDFFQDLPNGVRRTIAPEDRNYVLRMLAKEKLTTETSDGKYYRLIYRIQSGDEKIYHQLRAVWQSAGDGEHILMGIRNIDDLIRQRIRNENTMISMEQKENNHLEAVLATAAAYLEANISRDILLERSAGKKDETRRHIMKLPSISEISSYDELQKWIADHLIVENKEDYLRISSRDYLTDCFRKGDKRASVEFSILTEDGGEQPCRAVLYLYRERATGDIQVFCVIYDMTEQQKKERELKELEDELKMSRLRNSTSQMKPHFLYNALGSIQELILIDPEYASDLLGDFMVHMRSCVRAMESDEPIPFSEELKNIKAYVNIEKMRLGDKLDIRYEIREMDFPILPLCIQPLVENAIRHGIHKRGRKGGSVILRTRNENDAWVVQVEDSGVGFDVKKILNDVKKGKKDSAGLSNIRFRLKQVMGGTLDIQSTEGEGTIVTVRLPKEDYKNESNYSGRRILNDP